MAAKKEPRRHPAMTYEARISRGRIPIAVEMSPQRLQLLDLARELRQDSSRSAVIAAALDMLFKKMGLTVEDLPKP